MRLPFRSLVVIILLTITTGSFCQSEWKTPPDFEIQSIDAELYKHMITTGVFGDHSPVPIDRLRLIKLSYFGFDEKVHAGELIALDACSPQVLKIFAELLDRRFPFEQITLMTTFQGSDSLSMAANNTSCHNLRQITGGKRLSLHAYGTAIDINPVQNPFVDIPCAGDEGIARYQPAAGIRYANRMKNRLGKANRQGLVEEVIDVFAQNGFYWWGGYWNCPIDYQHFQISRSITELLIAMNEQQATQFFQKCVEYFNKHQQPIEDAMRQQIEGSFADLYQQDAAKFYKIINPID